MVALQPSMVSVSPSGRATRHNLEGRLGAHVTRGVDGSQRRVGEESDDDGGERGGESCSEERGSVDSQCFLLQ